MKKKSPKREHGGNARRKSVGEKNERKRRQDWMRRISTLLVKQIPNSSDERLVR